MLNDPYGSQSAIRAPRLRVMSGSQEIVGADSATVTQNNYYQCDTFRLRFAASAGASLWWDTNPPLVVDIQMSLDGSSWQSLIIGEVDHQQYHVGSQVIEMEGRDLSARFIEAKTQETFVNQTSSEVAKTLAARHGMTASVTKTTTPVGRYYEQDHTNISLGQFCRTTTEWDLLVYLAQREGFDVFMSGTTLNFNPAIDPSSDPFVLNWTPSAPRLNAINLSMERSLTLAKDVQVVVQSWNSRQARSFSKTARAIGGKASSASSSTGGKPTTTQKYVIVRPNLSEAEAQNLANRMAHEITLHERVVSVEMPGELTLTPRNMVEVRGTGSSFDQAYYVASIDRSMSFDEGFRQSMRLKNSSPRTQAQV